MVGSLKQLIKTEDGKLVLIEDLSSTSPNPTSPATSAPLGRSTPSQGLSSGKCTKRMRSTDPFVSTAKWLTTMSVEVLHDVVYGVSKVVFISTHQYGSADMAIILPL